MLQQCGKLELEQTFAEQVLGLGSSLGNTSEGGIFLLGHDQGRQYKQQETTLNGHLPFILKSERFPK